MKHEKQKTKSEYKDKPKRREEKFENMKNFRLEEVKVTLKLLKNNKTAGIRMAFLFPKPIGLI